MSLIGYHASHEQFAPSDLRALVAHAIQSGFDAISCSDHFHPWSERQGQSGYAFAWLGAVMQTVSVPFSMVTSPGYRYHPAIVAQAIATLCEMFPNRLTVALGSGEALNERITGDKWPAKEDRNDRLLECHDIIRRLLQGERVTHHGMVTVEHAKLYTLPRSSPPLFGAAITPETAQWMGQWTEGLITVSRPIDQLREVVDAYRHGGGYGKPMHLKVQLSYAETHERALAGAHDQWRNNIFSGSVLAELWTVEQFDALGKLVDPTELYEEVTVSSDPEIFVDLLQQYVDLGFERILLHNVNREQEAFIRVFAEKVLPRIVKRR
jgi:coenzyme F420-dependent glucose-6-phosphate dehydrogenase